MANHLSVATVIEKNRLSSDIAFVAMLEIDVIDPNTFAVVETLYLARNSEDITYQGNVYAKSSFDIETKAEAGTVPDITISARDFTRAIQAKMQQYAGGVGFEVRILIVNTGNLDQPPEVEETFLVLSANAKDYVVTFRLGAENPLSLRFPRRNQNRDRCPWAYKDPDTCGYTGPLPTCDFSLQGANGCAAHANSLNFGAFAGITSTDIGA